MFFHKISRGFRKFGHKVDKGLHTFSHKFDKKLHPVFKGIAKAGRTISNISRKAAPVLDSVAAATGVPEVGMVASLGDSAGQLVHQVGRSGKHLTHGGSLQQRLSKLSVEKKNLLTKASNVKDGVNNIRKSRNIM